MGETTVVVPGHGAPVDAAFVARQRRDPVSVAALIEELHDAGVAATDAVAAGGNRWAFPADMLATAINERDHHLAERRAGAEGQEHTNG